MQRLNLRSLTTLILFGIILAVCGPVSTASANDLVFITPTQGSSVTVGPYSAKLQVKFKTLNGFQPVALDLRLNGGSATTITTWQFEGTTQEYTGEFTVSTGTYPNTSIELKATKQGTSGGAPAQDAILTITGITVTKQ